MACPSCFETGLVQALPADAPENELGQVPYGFKCGCPAGERRSFNYPIWPPGGKNGYRVIIQGEGKFNEGWRRKDPGKIRGKENGSPW